ncbi:MAG: chorismate-binding protein, partial [Halobacteria archaeon]|nr:chorismate-binding protein [Halobacteria archaeon]
EVEPTERGPYTGSMGRISINGEMTLNILIRTLVRDKDDLYLQVGGGVVHDSVPEDEYDETLHKAEGVLNALERQKQNGEK